MAQITDTLMTVFQVSGISALMGALRNTEAATDRLTLAQRRLNQAQLTGRGYVQAQYAVIAAQRAVATSHLQTAQTAFSTFQQVITLAKEAANAYAEFGKEVMNIRDLTGSSAKESTRAAALFGLAGVSDVQEIREILRLEQSVMSEQGRAALGRLGVSANPNVSGLTLFNQVADALQRYPDGILKAQAMTDIFGQKSVQALLPLLRLTREQRERAFELADAFNEGMLPAIQQFQYSMANLGQTFQMRVLFPIAEQLLPIVLKITDAIVYLMDKFAALDKIAGGLLSTLLGFALAAGAVATLTIAVVQLWKAFRALAATQVLLTALGGPAGVARVAAAVAVAGGVYWGISKVMGDGSGGAKSGGNGPVDKFGKAVDSFDAAVNRMEEGWQRLNRGGVPSGLNSYSLDALSRELALPALG